MMLIYGCGHKMPFQLVDIEEVLVEAPVEENTDSVLEAIQVVLAIWDNIHGKAAHAIK